MTPHPQEPSANVEVDISLSDLLTTIKILEEQRDTFAGYAWYLSRHDPRERRTVEALLDQHEFQFATVVGHA
jgi:hypothetical protein